MVKTATGSPLSLDIVKQRVTAIINDPQNSRIKNEIDARIAALLAEKAFRFIFLPLPFHVRVKKPYSQLELDTITKRNARDQAIYAQWLQDSIFASQVDGELV
jgi:hypothetical protein